MPASVCCWNCIGHQVKLACSSVVSTQTNHWAGAHRASHTARCAFPGLMVNAELVKPQKPPQQQQAAEDEDAPAPAKQSPAKQQPPKAQPAKAQPKAPAAAPAIKRLVSPPTITRIVSGSSGAVGGEEASRSGTATPAALSRAASTSAEGGSRPASSLGTGPAAATAAARKQLEQQRQTAAALKSDIAAAWRGGSAAAPASSSSSSSAGGWGKVPRSISAPITPVKQEPAEDWPALGPVSVAGARDGSCEAVWPVGRPVSPVVSPCAQLLNHSMRARFQLPGWHTETSGAAACTASTLGRQLCELAGRSTEARRCSKQASSSSASRGRGSSGEVSRQGSAASGHTKLTCRCAAQLAIGWQ